MGIQDHLNEQAARAKELVKKQPGTTREQYEIRPAPHLDIVMQDGVPVKRRHLPLNGHHHHHHHRDHSLHQHNNQHQHSSSSSTQQYQRKRRRETDDWADSGGARTRPAPGAPSSASSSVAASGGGAGRDEYPLPRDHHRSGDSWRAGDDRDALPPPRRAAASSGGTESDRERGRERDWDRAPHDEYPPRDRGARRRSPSRDRKGDDRGGRGDGRAGGDASGRRRPPPSSTRQRIVYD
ncbi:hypothetical protein HDU87_000977 [Geranomyces variabilis]|uniref:Uncharacterized protein n=1 Tax=Geranomyces variabilis TaxID=109894 RepID=A0AAD5TBI9_9FUNG|nr:hypothetical protein HDU87_000977 [Geranomyces variabilis]